MRGRELTKSWALFIILGSFVLGVGVASWIDQFFLQACFAFLGIFIVGKVFAKTELISLFLVLLLVLSGYSIGIWRISEAGPQVHSSKHLPNALITFEGRIGDVDVSSNNQKLTIQDIHYGERNIEDKILVFTPTFPPLRVGLDVQISCELQDPAPFEGFSYDRFLASKQIYKTCFTHDAPIVLDQPRNVQAAFWKIKTDAIYAIRRNFNEPHATLLVGLLLGERGFRDVWDEAFVRTGTSHIVAASGYNVTIVSFVLFGLLTWLGIKRQIAFPFLLLGILAYVFLVGADAPIIRAGIMGGLVLLARFMGRKTEMKNIIILTVLIMLIQNPFLLRDDVGFQLSVLSTVGLIYISPFLDARLTFLPKAFSLRESFTATIAATVMTLPIIISSFGQLSLVSPFANIIILPIIPYAMLFGILAITIPEIGIIFVGISWLLLEAVLWVVRLLSDLPFASIQMNGSILYILFTLYICLCIYMLRKSSRASF